MVTIYPPSLYYNHFPPKVRIPVTPPNDNARQAMTTVQDLKMEVSLIYSRLRNLPQKECHLVLVHIRDQHSKIVSEINARLLRGKI